MKSCFVICLCAKWNGNVGLEVYVFTVQYQKEKILQLVSSYTACQNIFEHYRDRSQEVVTINEGGQ